MNAAQLLDELSVRIYESPLAEFRQDGRISDPSNPLSIVMLLIDYETECSMNGIVGFLGNSSGQRLPETIDAIRVIGCVDHAITLEQISATAASGGMTHNVIQQDRAGMKPFAVTSFAELHGEKWNAIVGTIHALHDSVDWDEFWQAATNFVGKHADKIECQL